MRVNYEELLPTYCQGPCIGQNVAILFVRGWLYKDVAIGDGFTAWAGFCAECADPATYYPDKRQWTAGSELSLAAMLPEFM
jgi:hypothetical protein